MQPVGESGVDSYIVSVRKELEMKALSLTIAAALALGGAGPALADKPPEREAKTPPGWSSDIKGGKRVPRGKRQVNADDSWQEKVRQGDCVIVTVKTSSGQYSATPTR